MVADHETIDDPVFNPEIHHTATSDLDIPSAEGLSYTYKYRFQFRGYAVKLKLFFFFIKQALALCHSSDETEEGALQT